MADTATVLATLRDLGFWFATDEIGIPQPQMRLELALREFQRAASEKRVAQPTAQPTGTNTVYSDRLKGIDNPKRFSDRPHGFLNDETKLLLELWTKESLRCPVVVEAWWTAWKDIPHPGHPKRTIKWHTRGRPFEDPLAQNLWLFDQGKRIHGKTSKGTKTTAAEQRVRMYAVDRSGWLEDNLIFQAIVKDDNGRIMLGHQENNSKGGQRRDGPASSITSGDVRFPVTPEILLAQPFDTLSQTQKITYRVVRAISEAEIFGFLDALTCYDRAIMSVGLFHWTVSHFGHNGFQRGELEAFFAYLKQIDSSLFEKTLGRFGLEPKDPWYPRDQSKRTGLVNSDQRKFNSTLLEYFWNEKTSASEPREMLQEVKRLDMLRSWHWFYRFQIAMRVLGLGPAMWDMARFRIRDLLAVEVPASLDIPRNDPDKPLVLGDLFRSEQVIVLLVECHVLRPADVLRDGAPAKALIDAIKLAGTKGVPLKAAPKTWGEKVEGLFSDAILKTFKSSEIKRRLDTAKLVSFVMQPHPVTQQKSLSLRRATDYTILHDEDLYPPPPWKS